MLLFSILRHTSANHAFRRLLKTYFFNVFVSISTRFLSFLAKKIKVVPRKRMINVIECCRCNFSLPTLVWKIYRRITSLGIDNLKRLLWDQVSQFDTTKGTLRHRFCRRTVLIPNSLVSQIPDYFFGTKALVL